MARKKKTTTLSSSQTLATPINSTIDSFLIGGKGPFYIDLPTDATPTITSLNVTNTITSSSAIISYIESYSAEITNLESTSFGTTTLTADEITTDTITINTSNGLSGDNLTVSNLYSSSTTNQVYCSTGNTSSSGSWKSLSISTNSSSYNLLVPIVSSSSYRSSTLTINNDGITSHPLYTGSQSSAVPLYVVNISSFSITGGYSAPKTFYLENGSVGGYLFYHSSTRMTGLIFGGTLSVGTYTIYLVSPSLTKLDILSSCTINFS